MISPRICCCTLVDLTDHHPLLSSLVCKLAGHILRVEHEDLIVAFAMLCLRLVPPRPLVLRPGLLLRVSQRLRRRLLHLARTALLLRAFVTLVIFAVEGLKTIVQIFIRVHLANFCMHALQLGSDVNESLCIGARS